MSTPDALEQELDMLLAKAGAKVPPHLKGGVLAGYREMKAMAAMVHGARPATHEPSNIFSLTKFVRSA
ncbi:MAG: hypothetical protein JO000_24685 [Alphaproteobacteria bacterium]|nr:hypothetical protein [Alphaproteobacteria bacterium]